MRAAGKLIPVAILAAGLAAAALPGDAVASGPSPLCIQTFPSLNWTTICFAPGEVAAAERELSARPVPPQAAIWRVAHMRLRVVALFRWPTRRVAINYLFGKIVKTSGRYDLGAPGSHYVLVTESVGHIAAKGMQVTRGETINGGPGAPKVTYGPWWLSTNVPARHLVLQVQSGEGRAMLVRVARAILRETAKRLH